MNVQPITLEGRLVRLEPLSLAHVPSLAGAIDAHTFDYYSPDYACDGTREEQAAVYAKARLADPTCRPFVVIRRDSGRVVGATCYLDIRPAHKGLEIGATFYAADQRGTHVNPECKLLLLAHAFDTLGCIRVQLKTDARNAQSRAAILKLGAKEEGTLRRHMVMRDGYLRDTVMYSITNDEWPAVRAGLDARLRR